MCLDGTWYNKLGSQMQLSIAADGSTLSGTYQTPVGLANGSYPLVGYCDPRPHEDSRALGFTVIWNNAAGDANSVTTWCGQYQIIDGREMISALWLLALETDPGDNWKSTMVGDDCFTRQQPARTQVARRMARGPAPFPPTSLKW